MISKQELRLKLLIPFLYHFLVLIEVLIAVRVERNALSETILHYEPLNYEKEYLHNAHSRVRRSLDVNEELHLNFRAHSRNFNLRLRRDTKLLANNVEIDGHDTFSPGNLYEGFLQGDSLSKVYGFVHDGIFEGRIYCGDGNEYQIESTKQHKHLDHKKFHSVVYNTKDIIHPKPHICGGVKANSQKWMNNKQNRTAWKDDQEINDHIIFNEATDEVKHSRTRRAVTEPKTECQLHIRADWTYVTKFAGSPDRAMYLMMQYVKSVSHIYEETDFDLNGVKDGYTLTIRRISVIEKTADCSGGNDCKFMPENIGVAKFLDISSLDDHDKYCLSYVFAHRDFSDGVLGLAWIGDKSGLGGICDTYQADNKGSSRSLNTGIVTNLNYGQTVASKVTEITLAHEIGHNFGSQHDPTTGVCAPGGSAGNFIMFPRATQGSDPNNYNLSLCSKNDILPVLKARASKCFQKNGAPICGNRIVEQGEQCDCGYADEPSCQQDKCCIAPANNVKGGCKFSAKAEAVTDDNLRCSPSNGLCCDQNTCKPTLSNMICAAATTCSNTSRCLPTNYTCPPPGHKEDVNTYCRDERNVCINGQCTGSICLKANKVDCQCTKVAEYCQICCQTKNDSSTCTPLLVGGASVKLQPPGAPCNQYAGYCDILHKCRQVDAEGPLSRLKKWLFSSQTFNNILDWMKTYWWACVLIGLGLVLFMAGFIACCSVHTPSSNPNKKPPRAMTLPRSLSRYGNRGGARPAPAGNQQPQTRREPPPTYMEEPLPGYNTAMRDNRQQPPSYGGSMELR